MEVIAAIAAILGILSVLISLFLWGIKKYRKSRAHRPSVIGLLRYVWEYPLSGDDAASWAVKESKVLRNDLYNARKKPGLGVAIFSTEFAWDVFGSTATPRIHACISWINQQPHDNPQRLLLGTKNDDRADRDTVNFDLRHTLAFAIILARFDKQNQDLRFYLDLVLELQNSNDGGWPEGTDVIKSELFTVMYAIELLTVSAFNETFSVHEHEAFNLCRSKAEKWLMYNRNSRGLWPTGVFGNMPWDDLYGTAWLLHRISPLARFRLLSIDLQSVLAEAASQLVVLLNKNTTLEGIPSIQRYRLESRIAAAITTTRRYIHIDEISTKEFGIYLDGWKFRAMNWLKSVNQTEWDLATSLFLLESLLTRRELRRIARSIAQPLSKRVISCISKHFVRKKA